jgi:hypothetical protein
MEHAVTSAFFSPLLFIAEQGNPSHYEVCRSRNSTRKFVRFRLPGS